MIRFFALCNLLFISLNFVQGQILLNKSSQQIEDRLIFNRSFILQNDIQSVSAEYMVKKDWQGLSKYGDKIQYQFDESGNLIYKKELNLIANNWETTEVFYQYNNENKIIEEKTSRQGGFWIKEFKYNEGRVAEVINYLVEDELENSKQIELNRQTFVWKTINDSTYQKSVANNYGQPYLLVTYFYDRSGDYLKFEEQYLVVTGNKERTTFSHNKFGWLKTVNLGGKISNFSYDDLGNVIEVDQNEEGQQKKHIEYLYKSNGLLEAQLKTEEGSSAIHILKYRIEHFTK